MIAETREPDELVLSWSPAGCWWRYDEGDGDTFLCGCCGFCEIERLSCQTAGTNGPHKIESCKIYHGNIDSKNVIKIWIKHTPFYAYQRCDDFLTAK